MRIFLRNNLDQVGLWARLWDIVLIHNLYRKTQPTVGTVIPLHSTLKENTSYNQAHKDGLLTLPLLLAVAITGLAS